MRSIGVGDVVTLKSGGRQMTVVWVGLFKVTCTYWDGLVYQSVKFKPQALRIV